MDSVVNLYSGAPIRGHVPVLLSINSQRRPHIEKEKKFDLSKMNWEDWSRDVELALTTEAVEALAYDETTEELWKLIKETIHKATYENCSKKQVTPHSKPYWTKELSAKSEALRDALSTYLTRNTDDSFQKYQDTKESFEECRKHACQQFIMNKTRNLNVAEANRFWKEFNRLFKPPSDQQVEALVCDDGSIITENQELEKELFDTFFRARHIEQNNSKFNQEFFEETNQLYSDIKLVLDSNPVVTTWITFNSAQHYITQSQQLS